jgi:PKD repeat protein
MKLRSNYKVPALVAALLACAPAMSQHEHTPMCNANHHMDELRYSDAAIAADMEQSRQQLEEWTEYYITNEYDPSNRTAIYTIPVVFHVIHTNGEENISDEQILDGLELLNDNFNQLNANWDNVNPAFLSIVADCQIEFKLAKKTNTGQCTNGITRTYSPTTDNGDGDDQVDAVQDEHGNWPGNKYLNIFVVNYAGGAAGYTTYPANWSSTSMENGIFIKHNYVGSIGTSNMTVSTALTHEVGHWLNLMHCWGNSNEPGESGNCGIDDNVADTPESIGWDNCNVNGISCGVLNNVENYMEYSYCSKMYTEGQKARMHAALNSNVGDRDNLWTAANLAATGVSTPDVLCAALFSADRTEICVGESVTFYNESYNTTTGTNWTFPGGSPGNSISGSPTITYDTPGIYAVTLQATDGSTTLTNTKTNYIVVLADQGESLPYHEGFESLSSFPDNINFTRIDEDGDEEWQITSTAFTSGAKSLKLNNYGTDVDGTKDAFCSGTIDLSGVASTDDMVFDFRYAYRKYNADDDEWLRFYISKDCGETWVLRKNWHGNSLSTITAISAYTPPNEEAWYSSSVTNITSDYYVAGFRYKFEFEAHNGNNIYIDDINLYPASMTGIELNEEDAGLSVYPNPVNDMLYINLELESGSDYVLTLFNALGESVNVIYSGELMPGTNQLSFSTAELPKGIYFLQVDGDGIIETRKIVKN